MAWRYIAMAALPRPPCWSAWNESRPCNLALRQMPHGIFSATAPLRALSWRYVRRGSGLRGHSGGDFDHPHMLGQTDWQPRRIASVRTSDGQQITVGLTDESESGTVIELFEENAAPFGLPRNDQAHAPRPAAIAFLFVQFYPAFFHAASASKTRRAAFAIAASIMRPSRVVEALPCASAWSNASNTRA